jgi:lysyl-tRNA synthetase class 2
MLEFYQAYATYEDLIKLTEELFGVLCDAVNGGSRQITYQGQLIDLSSPWKVYRFMESLSVIGGLPEDKLASFEGTAELARSLGIP